MAPSLVSLNCKTMKGDKGNSFNEGPLCFERKVEAGGEAGFNNQKPTHQISLLRLVTDGLTTKWVIEI